MIDGSACLEQVVKSLYTVLFSKRGVVVLTIVSGALLFLPESILIRFGINELVQSYRPVIGGSFLLLLTVLGVSMAWRIGNWVKAEIDEWQWNQKLWKELTQLDFLSFFALIRLLKSPNKTIDLPPASGITCHLVNYGFIVQLQTFTQIQWGGKLADMPYGPSEWLLKAYKSNKFQRVLTERQTLFDKEESPPGTTTT